MIACSKLLGEQWGHKHSSRVQVAGRSPRASSPLLHVGVLPLGLIRSQNWISDAPSVWEPVSASWWCPPMGFLIFHGHPTPLGLREWVLEHPCPQALLGKPSVGALSQSLCPNYGHSGQCSVLLCLVAIMGKGKSNSLLGQIDDSLTNNQNN